MSDTWVPAPPSSPPIPPVNIPLANSWDQIEGCLIPGSNPGIVDGLLITGVPAVIGAVANNSYVWTITLNDGGSPPNFSVDRYDSSGALVDHPLLMSGLNGLATFADGIVSPSLQITTGQLVVPGASQFTLPGGPIGSYLGSASPSGALTWFTPAISIDAPSNGNFYGRVNGGWSSGGIFTGVVTFAANNSVSIVGPAGSPRSILGGTGTAASASWRWQLMLGDQTSETGNNAGSNFALNALNDSSGLMNPSALTISRATLAATFGNTVTVPGQVGNAPSILINKAVSQVAGIAGQTNGLMRWQMSLGDPSAELGSNFGSNFTIQRYQDSGVGFALPLPLTIARNTGNATFGYGVTITGVLSLAAPVNITIGGGTSGQALTTDGAGTLYWADSGTGGGVDEAPIDGTSYARNNAGWVHLTHTDITDWATQLANYYPTSNPAGYQTAAQVNTTLGAYLPLTAGPASPLTGVLFSNQYIMLNGPGTSRAIAGANASNIPRWALYLGDQAVESGSNAGSNFSLQSYTDAGTGGDTPLTINRASGVSTFSALPSFPGGANGQALVTNGAGALSWGGPYALASALAGYLPLAGGAMTGQITSNVGGTGGSVPAFIATAPAPAIALNKTAMGGLSGNYLIGQYNGSPRWQMRLGGPTAETGANAGTDFALLNYSDAGVLLGTPLSISRATGAVSIPNLSAPGVMNDNRIINGDMRIDQRNGGAVGTAIGYTVDRWGYSSNQSGKVQWTRNPNGGTLPPFPYGLNATSLSAYTALAGDVFQLFQQIEADMISDFAWGTSQAQPVTLSFWAYSSLTGTFSGSITNYAFTRSYPFSYSIPIVNTWVNIAITIPGDTTGAWVMSGNAGSLSLHFDLGSGSNNRGPANAWASSGYIGVTGSQGIVATNNAVFILTGVKLEIGSVATPFNRQSLTKSLADCQRYYQVGSTFCFASGYSPAAAGLTVFAQRIFPVIMRAAPTQSGATYGNSNANAVTVLPAVGGCLFDATNTAPGVFQVSVNIGTDTYSAEL